jgi:hypothetical protein|tara:strand:+ start:1969 stop:2250 length:282 start_codon:yes stop_codon:yes gene_type:complete
MKVRIGYAEVLHITGTALLISGNTVAGIVFCILGFFGITARLGIELNTKEKEEQQIQRQANNLAAAGGRFLKVFQETMVNHNSVKSDANDGFH